MSADHIPDFCEIEGCPNTCPVTRRSKLCDDCRSDQMLSALNGIYNELVAQREASAPLAAAMTPLLMALRDQLNIGEDSDPRE